MEILTPNKTSSCDDLDVWRAFKGGDALAYADLYERYVVVLYQYAFGITGKVDATKGCVQDLFIELWKNKSELEEPESVRNYLLKSIRRKAIRLSGIHRLRRAACGHEGEYLDSQQTDTRLDEALRLRRTLLRNAACGLSSPQLEAAFLKFFGKLSNPDISAIMNISVSAVHNLISHAVCNRNARKS